MRHDDPVPAYVLWFGATGLTIARSLGRRGIPVIVLHDNAREVCLSSRYVVQSHVLPRASDHEQAWLDLLIERAKAHAPRKAVLFVASDECWLLTAKHRRVLEDFFHIALPGGDDLERWPDKEFQYEAAERLGVPYPRIMKPRNRAELDHAAGQIRYPCLVKPMMSHTWVRQYHEKLAFARTRAELLDRGRDAMQRGLQFVLQEYIPGGDDDIYGVFAYLDRESKPLASVVVRKIRQYEPRFGSGCLSQSVDEPGVAALGLRLVQAMGFHGICSIEFKRDARDGQLKLMEINVRAPLLLAVACKSGVDLPYIAYCDLVGQPVERPAKVRFGRRVGLIGPDIHTARFYRRLGQLSIPSWLASWTRANDLHFAWDDLRPFRRYIRLLVRHWREGKYKALPANFPSIDAWRAGDLQSDATRDDAPAETPSARPAAVVAASHSTGSMSRESTA
jgi:predicted ATP-grasp superfamily ATP-dependent carboligase